MKSYNPSYPHNLPLKLAGRNTPIDEYIYHDSCHGSCETVQIGQLRIIQVG
jgi:hypothetical protein